jgi:YaiO family outer membrane protein
MVSLLARLRSKGLDLNLPQSWKIHAGAQTREYTSTLSSRMAHVTLERYWGDLRTAYSLQVEKPGGWKLAPSQNVSIDYTLAPRTAVGLSFTSGREMAFFGSLGALNTEVRSFALHAEHSIKKEWSVNFNAGYFDHGTMPSHKVIRIGFSRNL